MDPQAQVQRLFDESLATLARSRERLVEAIVQAARRMTEVFDAGGKLLACGNGGSAADAQHLASELVNRFERERRGLPAVALTTDGCTMTSIANDDAFERVFDRQIQALGREGDLLLCLTTSGDSANLSSAVRTAQALGLSVIALTGRQGGQLARLLRPGDLEIRVPSDSTARIQEVHGVVIHCLCHLVDLHLARPVRRNPELE